MSEKIESTLHEAATVVLIRDTADRPEVLLLRRNAQLAFHGGSWVFPGGRIDPEDYGAGGDADIQAAAVQAAVREAHEEAGLSIRAEALCYFSHWTTPEGRPKRFSTWFFAAEANTEQVVVDGGEIHGFEWMHPAAALQAQRANEIELPAPTYVTLLKLQTYDRTADALEALRQAPPEVFVPRYHKVEGGACSVYEQDASYTTGDLETRGARHRLWMLESGWRYEREF
ncbi:MAG: NUDIX domain-containing protein [Gammaproteobacteria bacterium]|nr:NUDIX domain-containing protein [Gammaproteobacteria bacterium]